MKSKRPRSGCSLRSVLSWRLIAGCVPCRVFQRPKSGCWPRCYSTSKMDSARTAGSSYGLATGLLITPATMQLRSNIYDAARMAEKTPSITPLWYVVSATWAGVLLTGLITPLWYVVSATWAGVLLTGLPIAVGSARSFRPIQYFTATYGRRGHHLRLHRSAPAGNLLR